MSGPAPIRRLHLPMSVSTNAFLATVLFTVYVLAGVVAYERWGLRLGGVLVLPFLAIYTLEDVGVLLLFAVSAAAAFFGGEAVHRVTLLYGRRMLITFLLISMWTSLAANSVIGVSRNSVFMPLLPGLFAYNLHREGRPLWNTAVFIGWLMIFFLITFVVLRIAGVST